MSASSDEIASGAAAYDTFCAQCHGPQATSRNAIPDLRLAEPAVYDQFAQIVLEGARVDRGMPAFAGGLSTAQVAAIRAYVLTRRADSMP